MLVREVFFKYCYKNKQTELLNLLVVMTVAASSPQVLTATQEVFFS